MIRDMMRSATKPVTTKNSLSRLVVGGGVEYEVYICLPNTVLQDASYHHLFVTCTAISLRYTRLLVEA